MIHYALNIFPSEAAQTPNVMYNKIYMGPICFKFIASLTLFKITISKSACIDQYFGLFKNKNRPLNWYTTIKTFIFELCQLTHPPFRALQNDKATWLHYSCQK